ncbi:MAG: DUF1330 domain-containing protein [Pseudomonadota bacterium]
MAAYTMVHVDVHDDEMYAKYAVLATQAAEEFGGEFLVRGGKYRVMEGNGKPRNVIIKFKDFDTAVAWYESETYQKALEYSNPSSTRDFTIVEGV